MFTKHNNVILLDYKKSSEIRFFPVLKKLMKTDFILNSGFKRDFLIKKDTLALNL